MSLWFKENNSGEDFSLAFAFYFLLATSNLKECLSIKEILYFLLKLSFFNLFMNELIRWLEAHPVLDILICYQHQTLLVVEYYIYTFTQ